MNTLSSLPPPPKGQVGVTIDSLSQLPPPPKGQVGISPSNFSTNTPQKVEQQGILSSIGSSLWSGVKTVGNVLSSSEQAAGQDIAAALGGNYFAKQIEKATQDMSDSDFAYIKQVKQNRDKALASGDQKTVEKYDSVIKNFHTSTGESMQEMFPALTKTNGQVVGDFAGVLMDVLSAGSYGTVAKGAQTGNLLAKSSSAAIKTGLATKVATGAATGYGYDVAQNLQSGKTGMDVVKPGYGTLFGGSLPLATSLVSALGKGILAKTTGAGEDVLQQALDNPDAVGKAIKEYAHTPEAQMSLVDKARGAINDFLHQRSVEYGQALEKLPSVKTGKQDILASFADEVGSFGGSIKNGQISFKDTTLTQSDVNNIKKAFAKVTGWQDTSAKGLDGLRQALGNLMSDFKTTGNPRANIVIGKIKDNLTKSLSKQVPGYGEMLSTYGTKTQLAKNLAKELIGGQNAKPSTQLNSVMRLFKKDPNVLKDLESVMGKEAAQQFISELSGAVLSNWFPPGAVGNAARSLLEVGGTAIVATSGGALPAVATGLTGLAAMSPRIVGKGAVLAGKFNRTGIGTGIKRILTKESSQLNQ